MNAAKPSLELLRADPKGLRWDELTAIPWVRALEACPQDPSYHAEGNVLIHTRMVLEALLAMPAFTALPEGDRDIVFLACLMHDVAKPATTRTDDDGRITAKGHSRAGELMARRLLWNLGAPFALREAVCALIRYHQIPFYAVDRTDARRVVAEVSLSARCDHLALVAEADIRGRICADADRVADQIELFRELCREEGCLSTPRRFASDHTRFVYFRSDDTAGRHPDIEAWDDTELEVLVMCGLPGAGKDTWVRDHAGVLPVVSLDALRAELDVDPTGAQGEVVQAARERAKELLRRREPFVWNATNLSRQRRGPIIDLLADYKARVHIVHLDVPAHELLAQNRARKAAVPESVIRRMTERWEVPTLVEAHRITRIARD